MKTLLTFVAILMVGVGGLWGQDGDENPVVDPKWIGGSSAGNPEFWLCNEPCDTLTRRFIEIRVHNDDKSASIKIHGLRIVNGKYQGYSISGPHPSMTIHKSQLVPIPAHWSSATSPGPSNCYSYSPTSPSLPLPPANNFNFQQCLPITIPPNSSCYLLAELSVTFDCPFLEPGAVAPNGTNAPFGIYKIEAKANIELLQQGGAATYRNWNLPLDQLFPPRKIDLFFGCTEVARSLTDYFPARQGKELPNNKPIISPSISSGRTTLTVFSNSRKVCNLKIFSSDGKELNYFKDEFLLNPGKNDFKLNCSELPKGVFYIKIIGIKTNECLKLVKV